MPWNPNQYNQFRTERSAPFLDLISHIKDRPYLKGIDLGCGTGELTKILADSLTHPNILGIDTSSEMLVHAPQQDNLVFKQRSIEDQLLDEEKWDLIVANASLQWVDDHRILFSKIISRLNHDGQLAIQMPSQSENLLNQLLLELVKEEPYASALDGWKRLSPMLSMDEYATLIFEAGGKDIVMYQKMYPVIAETQDDLFEFIAGSALIPYMERLPEVLKEQFEMSFKRNIQFHFPKMPALYAFKRMMMYARFDQ